MTQRHSVPRWLGGLGLILALVGLVSQGTTSAQTLAETRQRADAGDANAQFNLGLMYMGRGVSPVEPEVALSFEAGESVPQDFTQAVAWYRKAADQGHADAQFNLAATYAIGQGVPRDDVEAHKWRILAASRGTGDRQQGYAAARDAVAIFMPPAQVAEAQRLAREWQAAFEERQVD